MKEALTKTEKGESNNIEILQENIRFLQKELLAKNGLIKPLMENQAIALDAMTKKKNHKINKKSQM